MINGQYMPGDTGGWPFGIVVKDSRFSDYEYDFKTLNSYDSDYANDSYSYFMIGASISKQKEKWIHHGILKGL